MEFVQVSLISKRFRGLEVPEFPEVLEILEVSEILEFKISKRLGTVSAPEHMCNSILRA